MADPMDNDVNKKDDLDWDEFVEDVTLKDIEVTHSDKDGNRLKNEAEGLKEKGNQQVELMSTEIVPVSVNHVEAYNGKIKNLFQMQCLAHKMQNVCNELLRMSEPVNPVD